MQTMQTNVSTAYAADLNFIMVCTNDGNDGNLHQLAPNGVVMQHEDLYLCHLPPKTRLYLLDVDCWSLLIKIITAIINRLKISKHVQVTKP